MHELAALRAPDVDALVEAARSQELPVRAERDRIDRLGVLCQRMNRSSPLDVPQADGRVEAGARKYQVHVGIGGAGTSGRPLDCVNLLGVSLQVMDEGVVRHRPDLQRHVVRAGSEELALWVPLDCVDFVL